MTSAVANFSRRLRDWPTVIDGLQGWRFPGTAFGAGLLSTFAQAPFNLLPILFLTLPTLVWLMDALVKRHGHDRRILLKKAALTGWAFAFGYFLFGLYWIGHAFLVEAGIFAILMPFAITILPAGLALFYALVLAPAALFWKPGLSRIFTLAIALAIADWMRGTFFTGFPWNSFGYIFAGEAGLSQLSALFGPYALSLFCVLLFAAPAIAMSATNSHMPLKTALKPALFAIIALALLSLAGHLRLNGASDKTVAGIKLRLVQPNIRQVDKWRPGNAGPIYRTMLKLSALHSDKAPTGLKEVTHLIWPETALPFFMARSGEAMKGIADLLPDHIKLITGALRYETVADGAKGSRNVVFNSLFVIDGSALIKHTFDKKHLVPFGEYLPFQDVLEAIGLRKLTKIRGRFMIGTQPRLIKMDKTPPFSPLICYEVVFPYEIIEKGERPQWLVNVTNDAWYGVSIGPYQHLQQSRIRAIETGLPMIRAANTGISAVIDPYGRVKASLSLASAGIIDARLPAPAPWTIQSRYGKLLFLLSLFAATTCNMLLLRQKQNLP